VPFPSLAAGFHFVFSSVRLLALRKRAPAADEPEDARPVGISCALRRAVTKAIFANASLKETFADHLAPQQLGVAVVAGATKLIVGLRELLDAEPSFGIFTLDISNAFNSVSRAAVRRQRPRRDPRARSPWRTRLSARRRPSLPAAAAAARPSRSSSSAARRACS